MDWRYFLRLAQLEHGIDVHLEILHKVGHNVGPPIGSGMV